MKGMRFFRRHLESSVGRLLGRAGLPTTDLGGASMDHFLGLGSPERLEGVVALELHGDMALLRSLAVAEARRGGGMGRALVAKAEGRALACGAREV